MVSLTRKVVDTPMNIKGKPDDIKENDIKENAPMAGGSVSK
jgi:hypothetical protein